MSIRRFFRMLLGVVVSMSLAIAIAPVASAHASAIQGGVEAPSGNTELNARASESYSSAAFDARAVANISSKSTLISESGKSELRKPSGTKESNLGQPALAPVIAWVLRLVIQRGIPYAIKLAGRTALQKAFRQDLLAQNNNRWHHIFLTRHKWSKVGAQGNRSKTADLLSKAAARGKLHKNNKKVQEYRWVYKGKTIVATVSKKTGQISDGWVK